TTNVLGGCGNGTRDPGEKGTDCGGACAAACDGEPCGAPEACASSKCENGRCGPSAGKTCGVGLPNACREGETCQQDGDCASDFCSDAAQCAAPSPNVREDGRRDGGETGVDCGGTATGKPCGGGEGCKTLDDCQSLCTANVCDAPGPTDG